MRFKNEPCIRCKHNDNDISDIYCTVDTGEARIPRCKHHPEIENNFEAIEEFVSSCEEKGPVYLASNILRERNDIRADEVGLTCFGCVSLPRCVEALNGKFKND